MNENTSRQTMAVAAVKMQSKAGNFKYNIEETGHILEKLNALDIHFALFPELNISGYTKNADCIENFIQNEKTLTAQLLSLSQKYKTAFAVGYPVKIKEDYYIGHHVFYNGKHTFTHLKTHLGPTEQSIYRADDTINTFTLHNFTIGLQLCYETHIPEISYIQAQQGAEILAMAFASPRETAGQKSERLKSYLSARAYDNACYLMACNLSLNPFVGISFIQNPKGKILVEENNPQKDFCYTNILKENITKIKNSDMAWFNKHKQTQMLKKYYS